MATRQKQRPQVVYYLNDNLLKLEGLTDESTGLVTDAATVTVHLRDMQGVDVAGQSWPTAMNALGGSTGDYTATLEDAMKVRVGETYMATVDANAGAGLRGVWTVPLKCEERHV